MNHLLISATVTSLALGQSYALYLIENAETYSFSAWVNRNHFIHWGLEHISYSGDVAFCNYFDQHRGVGCNDETINCTSTEPKSTDIARIELSIFRFIFLQSTHKRRL